MSDSTDRDIGVLEYEIVEEAWNEYQLADGTTLRARVILKRVGKPPPNSSKPYLTSSTEVFSVAAPLSSRSTPGSNLTPEEMTVTDEKINDGRLIPVKVIASSEPWNIYRIMESGVLIQGKLVLGAVYRVKDRYDKFGEPQYLVQSGPLYAPLPKGTPQLKRSEA